MHIKDIFWRESWKWEKYLILCRGFLVRLTAHFSSETMEATRQWDDILKELNEKVIQEFCMQQNYHPKDKEVNTFPDLKKLKLYHWQTCPARNTKCCLLGWCERTLKSGLNPHAEIKNSSEGTT